MKIVVLQSNYIPWKGYFDLINDADQFIFYDEVKYTKNDWRNRNKIYTKNGVQWITIPISKDSVKLKISEVKLPASTWQEDHFNILYFAYKRAPHFEQLEELMMDFYKGKKWEFLSEFNQYSIKSISKFIGINTHFRDSSEFKLEDNRIDRLLGVLEQAGATHYISGSAAKEYLEHHEDQFVEKKINLSYKEYADYLPYNQFNQSFEPYVSIIDLIAHIHKDDIANYIWART